ncbi:Class I peptide chain release factor [Kineococcus radiotolerans SRS30216 = ATCC BAA-149]|uniref:Class I peptide chain release factor n=1 Tax=Kineococcus radiotolerans (strain ATCC BAA-149 / DSM 14245 / SRS30216) TaxID=266940 RepID=A6W5J8_KINRD|nr:Class I peptide chain release factor [Kineococcus radiotolerans SRS30216 = ATCC BAA-149]
MGEGGAVDGDLVVNRRVRIPAAELHERFSRSSGPGGQGVNTTDSRVELSFDLARSPSVPEDLRERALERLAGRLVEGTLTVAASEHRAQLRNRAAAAERLRSQLAAAFAPAPAQRRPTRPTRGSQRRRLETKRQRSDVKRLRRSTDD